MPNAAVLDPSVYVPKTKPFDHQADIFARTALTPARALFAEQGTGKTKIMLDIAAFLTETNRIRGTLVLADNGLHQAWIDDEVPVHWPDRVPLWTQVWRAGVHTTKTYQRHMDELKAWKHAALFAMNIEAIGTPNGFTQASAFLKLRAPAFIIVDESTSCKTPKAMRTKAAWRLARMAAWRRILTGLPAAEGPLDLYAQFKLLGTGLLGFSTYTAYKHEYAIWIQEENHTTGRLYPVLKEYRNLDQLQRKVDQYSDRVLKEDCFDLLPKLYQKHRFVLGDEQRSAYNMLRSAFLLERAQSKEVELVRLTITRQMRLQQISCGFTPSDPVNWGEADMDVTSNPRAKLEFFKTNARLEAFKVLVTRIPKKAKVIVWCRYRADVDAVMAVLKERADALGYSWPVRYDGAVKDKQRAVNKQAFRDPKNRDVMWFVGNTKVGGKGLNLQVATYMIYYSNDWPLERRLNSEDRFHRAGQTKQCTIIDLVAEDTVDEIIIPALREKKNLQDLILADPKRAWI